MKSTGIFRRVDGLGRFVLPKELRKSLDINQNDYLHIFLEGDTIILRKSQQNCILCGKEEENLIEFREKKICHDCLDALKTQGE